MKRIIITALVAATFGSVAVADGVTTPIASRSEPASVTLDQRDRGINGLASIRATAGLPMSVDAGQFLNPSEQAIASDGQVTVYVFDGYRGQKDAAFSPR